MRDIACDTEQNDKGALHVGCQVDGHRRPDGGHRYKHL